MPKQTWIKIGLMWKQVDTIWMNVGGVWQNNVMSWYKVGTTWKECMEYPSDYVTLSSNTLTFTTSPDSAAVTVSSSNVWSATKVSDVQNIINTYTLSGGDGDGLTVSLNTKADGYYEAEIEVTSGTATAALYVILDQGGM